MKSNCKIWKILQQGEKNIRDTTGTSFFYDAY